MSVSSLSLQESICSYGYLTPFSLWSFVSACIRVLPLHGRERERCHHCDDLSRSNQLVLMRGCFWWWLVIIIPNPLPFSSLVCHVIHCSSLDIHTQSNLSEVEIVSLVHELIPRYRLRAETEFACSNEDFLQTPRIDGSDLEPLSNTQIRALLDYYGTRADPNPAMLLQQLVRSFFSLSVF